MLTLDLALVGFGNVGRRFVRLLDERRAELNDRHGLDWRIVGIATRSHGIARNPAGLDGLRAIEHVEAGASLDALDAANVMVTSALPRPGDALEFIEHAAAQARAAGRLSQLVVVETTLLDVKAGQPALDHVIGALTAGAHVVTANKGPVAFAFRQLQALAQTVQRSFLFEGAVMDGIPIFNMARETLPAVGITGFRGVVNSTTNYIISAMENGREFDESLREMQAAGIAEADESLDVDGWDAAAKASAVANVLMDADLTPQLVERSGIRHLTGDAVRNAVKRGRRMKLVARAERREGRVVARVSAEELPEGDLLATLRDQQNALVFQTELLGDFSIVQLGGGLTQTAYALVSDLVTVGKRLTED